MKLFSDKIVFRLKAMKIAKNVGLVDRIIRIIAAIVIGYLYFTKAIEGTIGFILLLFAIILILTSFIAFCPLYRLLGIRTCKVNQS